MTAEEARVNPDVVTGLFLVNDISTIVLFGSGLLDHLFHLRLARGLSELQGS